jgi:hypothetical protein
VTQFDSATGTSTSGANTGAVQQDYGYKYDANTMVDADNASPVADVVQDDILKMSVKVEGALTYSTTIGGSATVPQVAIESLDLVGHDDRSSAAGGAHRP